MAVAETARTARTTAIGVRMTSPTMAPRRYCARNVREEARRSDPNPLLPFIRSAARPLLAPALSPAGTVTSLIPDLLDSREGPRDECGVFGVHAPGHDVARLAYFALYAL